MSAGAAWDRILGTLAAVFTAPSQEIFERMISAWVICPGRRTVTAIYQLAEPCREKSHDAYHRFLRQGSWSLPALWRLLALALVAFFHPDGVIPLDLDDTLFHKTGRKIKEAAWWRDAVASTGQKVVHAFGLNLVVLTVRVKAPWGGEPLGLPVNMRLHRKGGPSQIDLAAEVALETASWFPDREFHLCADGFYSSLAGHCLERVSFTSRMRKDAALFNLPPERKPGQRGRPRKKGERLPCPVDMAASEEWWKPVIADERGKEKARLVISREVLWYKVRKNTPVLLVISRDPEGRERDDCFFTTDLAASAEEVVSRYAGRWSIEDTFRNVKQHLGGQQPQSWRGEGPKKAAAFSLILYSAVWLWYIQTQGTRISWIPTPWYKKKTTPSFIDALASLRRVLWRRRIFTASENPSFVIEIADTLIHVLSRAA
jgi:DDE superfamily endonuclease